MPRYDAKYISCSGFDPLKEFKIDPLNIPMHISQTTNHFDIRFKRFQLLINRSCGEKTM